MSGDPEDSSGNEQRASKLWFGVSLLFKSSFPESAEVEETWEEQIRVFEADTEVEALDLATMKGKEEKQSYRNLDDELVDWTFEGVVSVVSLSSSTINSGMEVFSRTVSPLGNGAISFVVDRGYDISSQVDERESGADDSLD